MKIFDKRIIGIRIRARKTVGGSWLIYELKDPDKQDYYNNRKPIDIISGKKAAISYVESLDDEVTEDGET